MISSLAPHDAIPSRLPAPFRMVDARSSGVIRQAVSTLHGYSDLDHANGIMHVQEVMPSVLLQLTQHVLAVMHCN